MPWFCWWKKWPQWTSVLGIFPVVIPCGCLLGKGNVCIYGKKTHQNSGFAYYFMYMLFKIRYAKALNQLWRAPVLEPLIRLFFTDCCLRDQNLYAARAPPGCADFCTDDSCNTGFAKETRVLPCLSTFLSVKYYQRSNITWFRISSGHCNPRLKLITW